jgi:hypothetical protein
MSRSKKRAGHDCCEAKTRKGGKCQLPAGHGTDHVGIGRCKLHAGSTPTHEKAASLEIAKRECATLGIPIETTPAEALIREVWEAEGNVEFYRRLVQELATHPDPDVFVEDDGEGHWERGQPGIYGRTYHVSGLPTGEAKPHVLVVLYNDERKRKVDASAAALRAGVEERRLQIAEADAQAITAAYMDAFADLGLTDRLEEFRHAFHSHLAAGAQSAHLGAARPT